MQAPVTSQTLDGILVMLRTLLAGQLARGELTAAQLLAALDPYLVRAICRQAVAMIGPPLPPPNRIFTCGLFGGESRESKARAREDQARSERWLRLMADCMCAETRENLSSRDVPLVRLGPGGDYVRDFYGKDLAGAAAGKEAEDGKAEKNPA